MESGENDINVQIQRSGLSTILIEYELNISRTTVPTILKDNDNSKYHYYT